MARKLRITKEMRAFLPFLQQMERSGKAFSAADIAKATGYKLKGSVKAKLSRGEWQATAGMRPMVRHSHN